MPPPKFTMPREDDDDGTLRQRFVRETHAFLNYLVEGDAEDSYDGLRAERVPYMREAWNEVRGLFRELEESVAHIDSSEVYRHGIGGVQLKFKLGNVARWSQRLDDLLIREVPFVWSVWSVWSFPYPWRLYWEMLLEGIDTLLESILDAIGFGSAPREMKDAIINAIKWLLDK